MLLSFILRGEYVDELLGDIEVEENNLSWELEKLWGEGYYYSNKLNGECMSCVYLLLSK